MTAGETGPSEVLLFDLGGILITHDNGMLFRRLQSRCRPGTTVAEVAALFADERWGTGAPIAELHTRFVRELGYGLGWDEFRADWSCHFGLVEPMIALVEELARGRRVALFSNTNAEHWAHLVALSDGRLGRFEAYLSHAIGLAKPSLAAFRHVATALGVAPARVLFFDDVMANVEGARAAALEAELFTDEASFRALLARRGIAPGRG